MTLPSSGPISIADIAAEYNVALPCVFPTAFHGKPGIAASGPLTIPTDFYGKSNVIFTPDGGLVSDVKNFANAVVTLNCNYAAVWTFTLPANTTASIASGDSATSVTFTLASGGAGTIRNRNFAVTGVSFGITANFTVELTVDNS